MADNKYISELPSVEKLTGEEVLIIEQEGASKKVTPEQIKTFAGNNITQATETVLGGIKAAPKTANETVPAKIGTDGQLYVPEGGGKELPINDNYSVLNKGAFVDLFEKNQEEEISEITTNIPHSGRTDAVKNLPLLLQDCSQLVGKYLKSIILYPNPDAVEKTIIIGRQFFNTFEEAELRTGTSVWDLDEKLYSIVPNPEDYGVETKFFLDGTDSRVEFLKTPDQTGMILFNDNETLGIGEGKDSDNRSPISYGISSVQTFGSMWYVSTETKLYVPSTNGIPTTIEVVDIKDVYYKINELNNVKENTVSLKAGWGIHSINVTTGAILDSNNRVTSSPMYNVKNIIIPNGYEFVIRWYKGETYVGKGGGDGWFYSNGGRILISNLLPVEGNGDNFRIVISKLDDAIMTADDVAMFTEHTLFQVSEETQETQETQEKFDLPQIFNQPIRRRSLSDPLRYVFFGSSWGQSVWWYLNHILNEAGITAELYCFYTGSATFEEWNQRWDADTLVDCWTSTNGSEWVKGTAPFRTTIENNIDMIGFHQGARASIQWDEQWEFQWSSLISKIKQSCGIDTVIAYNSTWCPASWSSSWLEGYTQRDWQELNYYNTKKFLSKSGLNNPSPSGACLWAIRSNPLLNKGEYDLMTDGIHPDSGLPTYAISACYYENFIAPMYGISIKDISWIPTIDTAQPPSSEGDWIDISNSERLLILQAIRMAQGDRFGFPEMI